MPKTVGMKDKVDGEFVFDINQYLIEAYPRMSLPDRRAVCSLAQKEMDTDDIEQQIDQCVFTHACQKQNWVKEEEEDDD